MRCIYCDCIKSKINFSSLFLKEDLLCVKCRDKLRINRKVIDYGSIKVEAFYDYDSLFKDLLIQFKECYDEALKDVFMYWLNDYINMRYYNYDILLMPSSDTKISQRGFNHLEVLFSDLKQRRITGIKLKNQLIQEGKSKIEREKMRNNFIYEGDRIDRVLVLDDVVTTGSSMIGIYNCLKEKVRTIKLLSLSYKIFTK